MTTERVIIIGTDSNNRFPVKSSSKYAAFQRVTIFSIDAYFEGMTRTFDLMHSLREKFKRSEES